MSNLVNQCGFPLGVLGAQRKKTPLDELLLSNKEQPSLLHGKMHAFSGLYAERSLSHGSLHQESLNSGEKHCLATCFTNNAEFCVLNCSFYFQSFSERIRNSRLTFYHSRSRRPEL